MITILQNKLFIALLLALLLVAGLATLRQHTATASGNNLAIPTHTHEPPTSPPAAPLRQASDDSSLWRELETPFEGVSQIVEDRNGNIWITSSSGQGGGLARFEQGNWIKYTAKSTNGKLSNDRIHDALFDRDGNLWLASFSSGVVYCAAQDVQAFQNLQTYTKSNTNGGLASDNVFDIFESNDGSLWFGTEAGLSRYDGKDWAVVADQDDLGFTSVREVFQDSRGRLWVSLSDIVDGNWVSNGVARSSTVDENNEVFQWKLFTQADGLGGDFVYPIAEDAWGNMWFGTNNGVSRFDGKHWDMHTSENNSLPGYRSWWLGENVVESGLTAHSKYVAKQWVESGKYGDISSIFKDSEHLAWFSGSHLSYYTGYHKRVFNRESGELAGDDIRGILEASDGSIWVVTSGGGVSRYQNGVWQTFSKTSGDLCNDYANEILEGRDGVIWVGTNCGVSRYRDGEWQTFITRGSDLPFNDVEQILEGRDGSIWVGMLGGHVSRYQNGVWQAFDIASGELPPMLRVLSLEVDYILEANDGAIWVVTVGGGVSRYYNDEWQTFSKTSNDFPNNDMWDILEGRDGFIWVETSLGGISHYQDGQWQTFNMASDDLPDYYVSQILQARDGAIWVTTLGGGVICYQNEKWQIFNTANGDIADDNVFHIVETHDGAIWIATSGGGVSRYQDDVWQTFNTASSDLPVDEVRDILEARDGAIWVEHLYGASRYKNGEWLLLSNKEYNAFNLHYRHDTEHQITDRDGFIWTATENGVVRSYPGTRPPWVRIVSVNDRPVAETVTVGLNFEAREKVDITFEADDLATAPEKLITFFQLTGVYTDWQKTLRGENFFSSATPSQYMLRIDEIPPGQHTLRIRAIDEDWNEAVATQDITVAYPLTIITYRVYPLIDRKFAVSELPFLGMVLFGLPSLGVVIALSLRKQRQKRWSLKQNFNPYISELAVTNPDMFFGREEIINDIITNINASNFAIYGAKRIGKTSILHQVAHRLSNQEGATIDWLPLMISLHGVHEDDFFKSMMRQIVVGLRDRNRYPIEDLHLKYEQNQPYDAISFTEDIIALRRVLDAQKSNLPLIMVLLIDEGDALNQYSQQTQAHLRTLFMTRAKDYLRIVLAAEKEDERLWNMTGSPWSSMIGRSYTLKQFTEQEARELITKPVPHYRYEKQAIELILERSQLVPRHIQNICREAVAMMLHEQKGTITRQHVEKALPEVQHLPELPQTSEVLKTSEISRTG